MMDCGIGLQTPTVDSLNDLFSFIGFGKQGIIGTPSTVVLDQDEESKTPDAAILAASKQLTYGICGTTTKCTPVRAANQSAKIDFQYGRCDSQTCRMTSGICVDCAYCLDHCICDEKKPKLLPAKCNTPECSYMHCSDCLRCKNHCVCHNSNRRISNDKSYPTFSKTAGGSSKTSTSVPPHRLSVCTKQALLANGMNSLRQQNPPHTLRKSPSLLSESSEESACLYAVLNDRKTKTKTPSPSPSKTSKNKSRTSPKKIRKQTGGNSRRYDMEDDGEYLYLTHRMLKEHTQRSSSDSVSHHSYASYNSSNTGSSRRRYNMGDDDEDYNYNNRTTRSHRRTASGGSSSSRKSNNSFSLLRGRRKNGQEGGQLFPSLSFGSNRTPGSNRTRGSATTAKRVNSHSSYHSSSLSSASSSYLEGHIIEEEPKKSWFFFRYESKE